MSDKTILEQWRAIAYDQQADRNKLTRNSFDTIYDTML